MDHRDAKVIRDALLAIVKVLERNHNIGRRDEREEVPYNERSRSEETPALSRR